MHLIAECGQHVGAASGSTSTAAAGGTGSNALKAAGRGVPKGPGSSPRMLPLAIGPHMFPYTLQEGSPKSTTDLPVPLGAGGHCRRELSGGQGLTHGGVLLTGLMLGATSSPMCQGTALPTAYLAAPPCITMLRKGHSSPSQIFW